MNLREKISARRIFAGRKMIKADALDGMDISRLLMKVGGKQIIRKAWGDAEVFTTLVPLSAKQAYARVERVLGSANVPYTPDSTPSKGLVEIEAVGEYLTTFTNNYMCPDEDAGIIVVVSGLGDDLSVVTLISQVY